MWSDEAQVRVVKKEVKLFFNKLSSLEEYAGLYVYKLEESINGKVISTEEGVTLEKDLDVFSETGVFSNTFKYKLVDVEKMNSGLRKSCHAVSDDSYIINPYEKEIEINVSKKYALIIDKLNKEPLIKDYIGTYHAVGYTMDYYMGDIIDYFYDLPELLSVLKQRDDIVFEKSGRIINIPYKSSRGQKQKTIIFKWFPSEEDYNKCLVNSGAFYRGLAPERVFGVKKIKHE